MLNQKNVFWEALLVAAFIFLFGILMGFFIENSRAERISEMYAESDLYLTDLNILLSIIEDVDCNLAIEGLRNFADEVFWQSVTLEEYDEASEISRSIEMEHKKYDLMRATLWDSSIKLKKRCGDFHTLVYIYEYNTKKLEQRAKQTAFSKGLSDIKDRQGEKAILIPFAGNIESQSIELLKAKYNITELPTALIDEKIKITKIEDIPSIEHYLV